MLLPDFDEQQRLIKVLRDYPAEVLGPIVWRAMNDALRDYRDWGEAHSEALSVIGCKLEQHLMQTLSWEKVGPLDTKLDGITVDIKGTSRVGSQMNWDIPPEAVGHWCVLFSYDRVKLVFSMGIMLCDDRFLRKGKTKKGNRDEKRSLTAEGKKQIHWLIEHAPFGPYYDIVYDYPVAQWIVVCPSVNWRFHLSKSSGSNPNIAITSGGVSGSSSSSSSSI